MDNTENKIKLTKLLNDLNYLFSPFYNIDYSRINDIKKTIMELNNIALNLEKLSLENNFEYQQIEEIDENNMVGLLPILLASKKFFPKNEDLVMFSEKILNIKINKSIRKSRQHIIGKIITDFIEIKTLDDRSRENKIKNYIYSNNVKKIDFFKEWSNVINKNTRTKRVF